MKNKSNLAIIALVVLGSLTVIIVVMTAGLFKSGDTKSNSSAPAIIVPTESELQSAPESEPEPVSEPQTVPIPADSSVEIPQNFENDIGQAICDTAAELLGVPFAENGDSPNGFDNSGFIYYVLRQNGFITCPRTTTAQSEMGARTDRDALKRGDLVFFSEEDSDEVSIGGIYTGGGKMIACLMPGTDVKEIDITTDYYVSNFFCGISLS